jgi:predicted enzyme related to lactoylglutathione lyase
LTPRAGALEHDVMPTPRLRSIVFDCDRPSELARFWAEVLHYTVRADDGDTEESASVVMDPHGEGPTIWFNRVPEPKSGKNRVHVDVNLESVSEIERVVALGATILRPLGAVEGEKWAIMADPEGNEFCAFPP